MSDNQPADLNKIAVSDIRGLSRSAIEALVEEGLLPPEIADEALSDDDRQQQEKAQTDAHYRQVQAQDQKQARSDEEAWLATMSQSYQQEYHQLMDTYDRDEKQYGGIKTEAEKLKERLKGDVEIASQFGVPLSGGHMGYYDRQQNAFVDASLQPLNADEAKQAADEFEQLSPKGQRANACYTEACHAYADADGISQNADASVAQTEQDRVNLRHSNGTLSEDQLRNLETTDRTKVDSLSQRLQGSENAEADIDAALTENSIPASRDESVSKDTDSKSTPGTSFASTIDGSSNGKTSSLFNAVARNDVKGGTAANVAAVRQTPAPSF